jgi:hypothetical protein
VGGGNGASAAASEAGVTGEGVCGVSAPDETEDRRLEVVGASWAAS